MAGLDEEIDWLDRLLFGEDPRAAWEREYDLTPDSDSESD